MDSRIETYKHKAQIAIFINEFIAALAERALSHDDSKLESPEVEYFDTVTERLKGLTYGSAEYKEILKDPAIKHHQTTNRHHPEFFNMGIAGMNLVDLVEMICDWKAASLRHADGDILTSIEINQVRFNYSDDLKFILKATVEEIL